MGGVCDAISANRTQLINSLKDIGQDTSVLKKELGLLAGMIALTSFQDRVQELQKLNKALKQLSQNKMSPKRNQLLQEKKLLTSRLKELIKERNNRLGHELLTFYKAQPKGQKIERTLQKLRYDLSILENKLSKNNERFGASSQLRMGIPLKGIKAAIESRIALLEGKKKGAAQSIATKRREEMVCRQKQRQQKVQYLKEEKIMGEFEKISKLIDKAKQRKPGWEETLNEAQYKLRKFLTFHYWAISPSSYDSFSKSVALTALLSHGEIFYLLGEKKDAAECYSEASKLLKTYSKEDDMLLSIRSSLELGDVYLNLFDDKEKAALEYYSGINAVERAAVEGKIQRNGLSMKYFLSQLYLGMGDALGHRSLANVKNKDKGKEIGRWDYYDLSKEAVESLPRGEDVKIDKHITLVRNDRLREFFPLVNLKAGVEKNTFQGKEINPEFVLSAVADPFTSTMGNLIPYLWDGNNYFRFRLSDNALTFKQYDNVKIYPGIEVEREFSSSLLEFRYVRSGRVTLDLKLNPLKLYFREMYRKDKGHSGKSVPIDLQFANLQGEAGVNLGPVWLGLSSAFSLLTHASAEDNLMMKKIWENLKNERDKSSGKERAEWEGKKDNFIDKSGAFLFKYHVHPEIAFNWDYLHMGKGVSLSNTKISAGFKYGYDAITPTNRGLLFPVYTKGDYWTKRGGEIAEFDYQKYGATAGFETILNLPFLANMRLPVSFSSEFGRNHLQFRTHAGALFGSKLQGEVYFEHVYSKKTYEVLGDQVDDFQQGFYGGVRIDFHNL
ncbi:MAG: hypothetical protein HQ564_05650 [Candidatus Saganbacteria bacterium]|nr:hypothetical protein [Candidatus Saganbacteria bacterium]